MPRFSLLLIGLLWTTSVHAQVIQNRNSIRLGVDWTSLDAPDAVGPRYVARLARHFGHDRFLVAAEAGYLRKTTSNQLFNEVNPGPNQRERLTVDLTVFYDFLRHPRHALRLGTGWSAWYRGDDIYRGARAAFTPTGLQAVVIDRQKRHELNMGGHVALEYAWLFAPHWSVDMRVRLADLNRAGISSMLGGGLTFHF
ncbi:hypothetical protein [Larkinella humicola]|uniref:Outer membrane protein beta-barrel domain-containing protein n=1 Tax=Larkinella humicola TaxID=2607654 RepID=A0A5N1JAF3_9BACT|nr:hypothetical protein [Larkinella humicola]KAA9347788.1 hypothetical protein F0P93_24470 [Larkinella humicola]